MLLLSCFWSITFQPHHRPHTGQQMFKDMGEGHREVYYLKHFFALGDFICRWPKGVTGFCWKPWKYPGAGWWPGDWPVPQPLLHVLVKMDENWSWPSGSLGLEASRWSLETGPLSEGPLEGCLPISAKVPSRIVDMPGRTDGYQHWGPAWAQAVIGMSLASFHLYSERLLLN